MKRLLLALLPLAACQNTAPADLAAEEAAAVAAAADRELEQQLISTLEDLQGEIVKLRLEIRRLSMNREAAEPSQEALYVANLVARRVELMEEYLVMQQRFAAAHPSMQAMQETIGAIDKELERLERTEPEQP